MVQSIFFLPRSNLHFIYRQLRFIMGTALFPKLCALHKVNGEHSAVLKRNPLLPEYEVKFTCKIILNIYCL
jgi:hypothetical protein